MAWTNKGFGHGFHEFLKNLKYNREGESCDDYLSCEVGQLEHLAC